MTDKTHFSFGILIRPLDWRFGANRTNRVMGIQIGPFLHRVLARMGND